MAYYNSSRTLCGCWYVIGDYYEKKYLPLVDLKSHTTILATTSRTKLTQTFQNPLAKEKLDEVQYTFPLYDGVSVVSFKCTVAGRTIVGKVKEKNKARADYQAAVDRGETAGLLEQIPEASDVFSTKVGNIPTNEKVIIEIEYLGELKHDAETDGSRFTIPTIIAPRYGSISGGIYSSAEARGINISVDIAVDEGSVIRGIQSPSHPIAVTMGRVSTTIDEEAFDNCHASATLTLGTAVLEKDFVIVILAKGQDTPRALLETHPSIPNQRALMTTLVPKFNLPSIHPEIVFVVDRSGSMGGKIPTLVAALKVFLKSLPVAVKFNICSFGNHHQFMFPKSRTYDQTSLKEARDEVECFSANFGGTEMYPAIKATVENRLPGLPLEVLVLTDGEICYINTSCTDNSIRVFSLGIGSGASSSLVEGIARAGDGFAQFVDDNEKMDKRVVRMLKGALSPHIKDYKLEVKYAEPAEAMDDDFEMIESVETGISKLVVHPSTAQPPPEKKSISLFDTTTKETPSNPKVGRYDHLPTISPPPILQAPHKVPTLYTFNRTTVYLLLGPNICQQTPKSVILRATSEHGPLGLEIPVQDVGSGQTIHQLAAKKAVHELEQGRGWLSDANVKSKFSSTQYESRMDEIIEREAVRLGVQFQVGGKFCSFVAVEEGVAQEPAQEDQSVHTKSNQLDLFAGSSPPGNFAARPSGFSPFGSTQQPARATYCMAPSSPNVQYNQMSMRSRAAPAGGLFGASAPPQARHGSIGPQQISGGVAAAGLSSSGGTSGGLFSSSIQMSQAQPPSPPKASGFGFGSLFASSAWSPASILGSSPVRPLSQASGSHSPAPVEAKRKSRKKEIPRELQLSDNSARFSVRGSQHPVSRGSIGQPVQETTNLPQSNEEKVLALIDLNNFDGSWEMTGALEKIMGKDWEAVKGWGRDGWSDAARATAILIAYLELKMLKQEEVWEMVVEKARAWLVANVDGGKSESKDGISEVKGLFTSLGE